MSNLDQTWRNFIPCRDIIHPGFPNKGKPITPITIPSNGSPKRKNQKESNKLSQKPKIILTSPPQGR